MEELNSTSEPSEKTSWCLGYYLNTANFPKNMNLDFTRKHVLKMEDAVKI